MLKIIFQEFYFFPYFLNDTASNTTHVLEVVEAERDLGVVLSNDVKWHHQVVRAASKASQINGMILNAFKTRETNTIKTLYTT